MKEELCFAVFFAGCSLAIWFWPVQSVGPVEWAIAFGSCTLAGIGCAVKVIRGR